MARGFLFLQVIVEEIMTVRGIRGATTICEDQPESIRRATRELLLAVCAANPSLQAGGYRQRFFYRHRRSSFRIPGSGSSRVGLGRSAADVRAGNPGARQPALLHPRDDLMEYRPGAERCPPCISAQCRSAPPGPGPGRFIVTLFTYWIPGEYRYDDHYVYRSNHRSDRQCGGAG